MDGECCVFHSPNFDEGDRVRDAAAFERLRKTPSFLAELDISLNFWDICEFVSTFIAAVQSREQF